jgi:hypothetical protein
MNELKRKKHSRRRPNIGLTVEQLRDILGKLPAQAEVCLHMDKEGTKDFLAGAYSLGNDHVVLVPDDYKQDVFIEDPTPSQRKKYAQWARRNRP